MVKILPLCLFVRCMHYDTTKDKGKCNVNLYRAYSRMPLTRSDIDHTVLLANNTISALTRKHSPGAPPRIYSECVSLTYYSFIDSKRMNGLVGNVGWRTADGLPRGGHPSTARHRHGAVQVRESLPVIGRRS